MLFLGCLGISSKSKKTEENNESVSPFLSSSSSSSSDDLATVGAAKIKLTDGRHLAYIERGVPKYQSRFRVIIVHGFGSSKEMSFLVSDELVNELGIYILLFDRAGYGESDPNPKRSVKSEASDIQEIADQLDLGPKFYVVGVSLGCYPAWSCINLIPERLAGVALVVPTINYNWPSLPSDLVKDDYRKNMLRLSLFGIRYVPKLLHWWMTQKIFPSSSVLDQNPTLFSNKDLEVLKNTPGYKLLCKNELKDKVVFDSLCRDFLVAFSKWDFDPLQLINPYPENKSSVHIWQGYEDKVVPAKLQRFVSKKLPWIKYHEVPDGGHLLVYDRSVCEAVLKSLLLDDECPLYKPESFN